MVNSYRRFGRSRCLQLLGSPRIPEDGGRDPLYHLYENLRTCMKLPYLRTDSTKLQTHDRSQSFRQSIAVIGTAIRYSSPQDIVLALRIQVIRNR